MFPALCQLTLSRWVSADDENELLSNLIISGFGSSFVLSGNVECELAVEFRGDRNGIGMTWNELLEESEYSAVSASIAAGPDEDHRGTSATR